MATAAKSRRPRPRITHRVIPPDQPFEPVFRFEELVASVPVPSTSGVVKAEITRAIAEPAVLGVPDVYYLELFVRDCPGRELEVSLAELTALHQAFGLAIAEARKRGILPAES